MPEKDTLPARIFLPSVFVDGTSSQADTYRLARACGGILARNEKLRMTSIGVLMIPAVSMEFANAFAANRRKNCEAQSIVCYSPMRSSKEHFLEELPTELDGKEMLMRYEDRISDILAIVASHIPDYEATLVFGENPLCQKIIEISLRLGKKTIMGGAGAEWNFLRDSILGRIAKEKASLFHYFSNKTAFAEIMEKEMRTRPMDLRLDYFISPEDREKRKDP
jgi:hypothetical protein